MVDDKRIGCGRMFYCNSSLLCINSLQILIKGGSMYPRAKTVNLQVDDFNNETIICDLEAKKAHCLNRTAALVWRRCDGATSIAQIATSLQTEFDVPINEDLVVLALQKLAEANLLINNVVINNQVEEPSRRAFVKKIAMTGAAALLAPVITSIVVPTPAEAGSAVNCANTSCWDEGCRV
ncbi:MAG: PqqD family peptide modification chaperone [Candidatus Electrothrix sp. AW5]|nr:PqqD family peptide modification chaperone [Candidatus Electrothrix gigas]